MSFVPLPRLVFPTLPPFFSDHERAVNKAFRQVQPAAHAEVFGEGLQHPLEPPVSHPLLESTVAGLVRCKPVRQVIPSCTRAQYPEDAVENFAVCHESLQLAAYKITALSKTIARRLILRVMPCRKVSTTIFEIASRMSLMPMRPGMTRWII